MWYGHTYLYYSVMEISESQLCMHAKALQSCSTLCGPMDDSPPGSSVHRILQARVLEWGAIAFSSKYINSTDGSASSWYNHFND